MAISEKLEYDHNCHWCSCFIWNIFIIILVPSLVFGPFKLNVKYDELGIAEDVAKKLDTSRTYTPGWYTGWKMHTHDSTFRHVAFENSDILEIFDMGDLEFNIEVHVYWRLATKELINVFLDVGSQYPDRIKARMFADIKNSAKNKDISVYLENRQEISDMFYNAIIVNITDGIESPVGKLHLGNIILPEELLKKYSDVAVVDQQTQESKFAGTLEITRRQTNVLKSEISREIKLVNTTFQSNASKIISDSVAVSNQLERSADIDGQNAMFRYFNFTNMTPELETRIIELILQRDGNNNPKYIVVAPGSSVIINPPSMLLEKNNDLLELDDNISYINIEWNKVCLPNGG